MSEPADDKTARTGKTSDQTPERRNPASGAGPDADRQRDGATRGQPQQNQPRQNQPQQGHTPEDDLTEREGHAGSTLDVDAVTELHDAWQQAERSRPKLSDEDKDGLGPIEHEVRRRTEDR